MSGAFYVAASGLQAQQQALDAVANNIANVNTPSFKRSHISFSEVVIERSNGGIQPLDRPPLSQLSGVRTTSRGMFSEKGEIERTGQALDLAIDGTGFIELMGPGGQSMLWRGGRLRLLEDGSLASDSGIPLRSSIVIPSDARSISIAADGTVSAVVSDSEEAIELGQIMLVRHTDDGVMERMDGGLYRVTDGSVPIEGIPGEDAFGTLAQGAVERSTVSFNQEMVQMLLIQRAYAANAQIVQSADQLLGIANNLRRS